MIGVHTTSGQQGTRPWGYTQSLASRELDHGVHTTSGQQGARPWGYTQSLASRELDHGGTHNLWPAGS